MSTVRIFVSYEVPENKYKQIKSYVQETMENDPQYNLDASLNGADYDIEREEYTFVCCPCSPIAEAQLMAGIVAILNGDHGDNQ